MGIKAHAQLALKDKGHEETALIRIVGGVDRTTRLANQLLTLSGVDAMSGLEKATDIDVKQLIERVIEDLYPEITQKFIKIITQFDSEKRPVGNEYLLYTLMRNLIENAVRYSTPHSEVKVLYLWDKQALCASIIDQGPGIPVDQHDRVFDRFYRDIDAEGNGSGLGLAIARQIAILHGAEIHLAFTESGQDLSVTVSFKQNEKIQLTKILIYLICIIARLINVHIITTDK